MSDGAAYVYVRYYEESFFVRAVCGRLIGMLQGSKVSGVDRFFSLLVNRNGDSAIKKIEKRRCIYFTREFRSFFRPSHALGS